MLKDTCPICQASVRVNPSTATLYRHTAPGLTRVCKGSGRKVKMR